MAERQIADRRHLLKIDISVKMRIEKLCCLPHLQRAKSALYTSCHGRDAAIGADEMTVQSVQHMVDEKLGRMVRLI